MTPLLTFRRLRFAGATRRIGHLAICAILISAISGVVFVAPAQGQMRDEYQVKAAFLYNFARFVEWPAEAFTSPADPIVICILGKDPFGHWLNEAIHGRSIDGRALTLRHIAAAGEAASCQIVFTGSSEPKRVWTALAGVRRVLTVGECGDASEGGAIVNFVIEDGKVRFEINTDAAELGKVRISSRLLSLARLTKR
jgi:hypothetical protein